MGRAKQELVAACGRTWRERALAALAEAGASQLLLVGGEPPMLPGEGPRGDGASREEHTARALHVPDRYPGEGPLAGLEAALRAASTPWCLVVACDMPALDPASLRRLWEGVLSDSGPARPLAVVPVVEGRLQPLHALYHRDALPQVEEALAAGRRSLTALVEALPARLLVSAAGPSFLNANTPEDLEALAPELRTPGLTPPRTA